MLELPSLDDDAVLRSFARLLSYRSRFTAAVLAHIAEIDARHLYLREGFESMKAYCMAKLELTEDAAAKRLQVARLARQMPALFTAIADGRLHLKAARLLAPRLNSANIDELIAAAAHRTSEAIETELARRFPRSDNLPLDDGISPQVVILQSQSLNPNAPGHSDSSEMSPAEPQAIVVAPKVRTRIEPISATRYTLQVTLSGETHEKLRRLQDLLAHAVPNRDVAEVIDRSFDALIVQLEKRKFGTNAKCEGKHPAPTVRTIPAQIKKAVFDRDGGRCVYRFEDGRACDSRSKLEFDHIVPVAKGGRTTIDNLRLLCRAHNQYAAEQEFGRAFMDRKRPFSGVPGASRKGSGRRRSRSSAGH